MKLQKYFAELIGTFALAFGVLTSLTVGEAFPVMTPLIAALTVGLFVYTVGEISGAHLNPAVTIGLWTVKKIKTVDGALYLVSQFLGAVLAMLAVRGIFDIEFVAGVNNDFLTGLGEFMGAFILVFGISSVVHGKTKPAASGLVIGGSLLLGILLSGGTGLSNGVLNPAVAVGIGSFSWLYLLAPVLGAIAAAWVYKLLVCEGK